MGWTGDVDTVFSSKIEQKPLETKKSKETIDLLKQMVADGNISQEVAEKYCPDLKFVESEDERIRKCLLYVIEHHPTLPTEEAEEYIAWLEKQGEHANFRNKIQIGDKVTRNQDGMLVNLSQLNRVAKKDEKQVEQKPAEFDDTNAKRMFIKALERVEEQNNKGYKLTDCDKNSWWEDFKAYTSCIVEQNAWSEEDDIMVHDIDYALRCQITYPISKLQSMSNWIFNLKDRLLPQLKQEWSEDDEIIVDVLYAYAEKANQNGCPNDAKRIETAINKLKSLRPQSTWKPSDEYIQALDEVYKIHGANNVCRRILFNLMNDLKKLREE